MIQSSQLIVAFVQARLAALRDERGATAVEYGLMVTLIAVAIITTVGLLGTSLDTQFNNVKTAIDAVTP